MLKNQGFSNVQSKISQRPGKIFQKFQKILRDHGLKRPFLALLVLGTIHVLFLRVLKLQSSDFFLKKHRFFVCRFENQRFYFFGTESTIFERFRSSAFQNTKNYHLTPKTRGDTTLCVEPTTPGSTLQQAVSQRKWDQQKSSM